MLYQDIPHLKMINFFKNIKKMKELIKINDFFNIPEDILNELSEVEDIDQIKDLKEKLLNLTECYKQLIEEIF